MLLLASCRPGLQTQYISTTKSLEVAQKWPKKDGLRIVEIDVSKLGRAKLTDLTNPRVVAEVLRHRIGMNFVKSSAEVLINGSIPAGAMKVIFNP